MSDNTQDQKNKTVEKQANSIVLFSVLGINAALAIVASFIGASTISNLTGMSFGEVYMVNTFQGVGIFYTGAFLIMLVIFILNRVISSIGEKVPLAGSIIRMLLRLPVNIVLVLGALYMAFVAYAKIQVPGSEIAMGPVVIDIGLVLGFLFLTFFVKKI